MENIYKFNTIKRDEIFFFLLFLFTSILASLRSPKLNDYEAYFQWFIDSPSIKTFFFELNNLPVPTDLLFFFILAIFKTIEFWQGFLFTLFFLTCFLKYLILKKSLNSKFIFIFYLLYFSLVGFQFDLVQFRFGSAVSFFLFFLFTNRKIFLFSSILMHFGILIYFPAYILTLLFIRYNNLLVLKLFLFLLFCFHLMLHFRLIDLTSILNLDILIWSDYLFGKVNNQFLFAQSEYSLVTLIRNSSVVLFLIFLNAKFIIKFQFLYCFSIFVYFLYLVLLPIDNFNARLMPIFEILFLIMFVYWLQIKFKHFYFLIFIVSFIFFAFTMNYFFQSPTMYIK